MSREQRIREIMRESGVSRKRAEEIAWLEEQDPPGDTYTLDRDGNPVPDDPGPDIRSRIRDDE